LRWIKLKTEKFRKLQLPFPVWTYYEGMQTVNKRRFTAPKPYLEWSDIVRMVLSHLW
jgi:hypothetical protein